MWGALQDILVKLCGTVLIVMMASHFKWFKKVVTLEKAWEILQCVDEGWLNALIMAHYKLSNSTVSDIKKMQDKPLV